MRANIKRQRLAYTPSARAARSATSRAASGTPAAPDQKAEAVALLHRLMREGFGGDEATETAMRSWAANDPDAAQTLSNLDVKRIDYLQQVLRQLGVTNPDIARSLYAAKVGMASLSKDASDETALTTLVDLVLALR